MQAASLQQHNALLLSSGRFHSDHSQSPVQCHPIVLFKHTHQISHRRFRSTCVRSPSALHTCECILLQYSLHDPPCKSFSTTSRSSILSSKNAIFSDAMDAASRIANSSSSFSSSSACVSAKICVSIFPRHHLQLANIRYSRHVLASRFAAAAALLFAIFFL